MDIWLTSQFNMDRRGVRTEQAVAGGPPGANPDDSARVQVGQLIGRYRLLFPIAAGGMAEVWAAKPEGTGISRAVALKLVRPEFAVEAEYARMFIDEAVIASTIRHPNICETYELGRDENLLFMVMEWVAGDTLSGLMRGSALSPLPIEVAVRICAEACAGPRSERRRWEQPRHRPSRHLPAEHPGVGEWARQSQRLRHRQGGQSAACTHAHR
jgi:serine/threonine protein kinase